MAELSDSGPGRLLSWLAGGALRDDRPQALTRWFAAAGALAIGLFSVAMAWQLDSYLEERMLARDAELSRDFVQSIARIQQVDSLLRAPRPGSAGSASAAGDDASAGGHAPAPGAVEFFAHVAAMPDVLRANVYDVQRRVAWSSQAEMIGRTYPGNDELEQALAGRVVVRRADGDHDGTAKAEHQGLDATRARYVEQYLPVFDAAGGQVLAVIELYRRPDALFAAIDAGRRRIWLGGVLGGLFLFGTLVWFVRRTEQALRQQQQRLVEAQTLAAVGELSAAVAHSIRNPLGSIRSSAELQRELHGDPQGQHGETMANVDRIEHLVRTLLTYAADSHDRQASADAALVLRESAERFAGSMATRGTRLELDLGDDLGAVATDPVVLAQVFNSLLANAAEATRAGDAVRLAARREGRWIRVDLADSGSGIAAERLAQVFQPFFTTKPRGLGLGLPLARRIVQRLGGSIELDSRHGQGTRVAIRLPAQPAPAR